MLSIKSGANFYIAGEYSLAVFIGEVPKGTPNLSLANKYDRQTFQKQDETTITKSDTGNSSEKLKEIETQQKSGNTGKNDEKQMKEKLEMKNLEKEVSLREKKLEEGIAKKEDEYKKELDSKCIEYEKTLDQKDDEYENILNEMDKGILGLMEAFQNLQNDFTAET